MEKYQQEAEIMESNGQQQSTGMCKTKAVIFENFCKNDLQGICECQKHGSLFFKHQSFSTEKNSIFETAFNATNL